MGTPGLEARGAAESGRGSFIRRRRPRPTPPHPPAGAAPRDPGLVTGGGRRGGKPAAPASRGPSPTAAAAAAREERGPPPGVRASPRVRVGAESEREREPGRARWAPPAMDHKPLLQERPPAYNLEAGQGDFACGPHGYGAIPAAAPPPPYPYLVTGGPGARGAGWGSSRDWSWPSGRGPGPREQTLGGVLWRPLTPKPTFLRTRQGRGRGETRWWAVSARRT